MCSCQNLCHRLVLIAILTSVSISTAVFAADDFAPKQDVLPVKPPSDAVVLFDGEGQVKNLFLSKEGKPCDWKIKDGELVSTTNKEKQNHIVSQYHFRDADIHAEFNVVKDADGNSGLYIHGLYEMQIFNSFGKKKINDHDEGSLYGFNPPLVNASKKPGEWQVYDIRYRAPRRNEKGEISEQGEITAWLNGQKVQDKTKFGEGKSTYHPYRYNTTPYLTAIWDVQKKTLAGPVFLQDHGSPCRFRNVWVKPLDDQAHMYTPSEKPANGDSNKK